MSAVNLLSPILNGGIQNVNFVNGRVLTAADMTAERAANIQRQRLMGECVGEGVATGLEVTFSSQSKAYGVQVVHVTAGVAVNRNGEVLQLASDIDLSLVVALQTATATPGTFNPCEGPQTILTNPGIWVLTIQPATGYQGQAPTTQLNSNGVATICTSQYKTSGVQFQMSSATLNSSGSGLQPKLYALANEIQTKLNAGAAASSLGPQLSQFRNGLAHVCFGTEELASYAANPFAGLPLVSAFETYGLIDALRNSNLMSDCSVPLAIMYWTQQGIQFVDMWSVRRPVFPTAASEDWPIFTGRRRAAEGMAMFLQFQDQINDLLNPANGTAPATSISGSDYFVFLPSAGLLPIPGVQSLPGFNYPQFFGNQTVRPNSPAYTRDARFTEFLRDSFLFPPINLASKEIIWLYLVPGNIQFANQRGAQPYVMFAGAQLSYQGDSRFDASYWDFSNYSLVAGQFVVA